jgi:hypothetical protein
MNKIFYFLFCCILLAQVLLSERPAEINFPLLFHVGTLGLFLVFGFFTIMMEGQPRRRDAMIYAVLAFLVYFFTIGVIISALSVVRARSGTLAIIEFPYRISNLFMVLVIPWFIRSEKKLDKLFALVLVAMGLQILRDLAVGSGGESESLLMERLWGPEFSSAMFLGALPFAFGGMIAYWNVPRYRFLKRLLLVAFWAILSLKLFLTYSRAVWLLMFPLNIAAVFYLLRRKSSQLRGFRTWTRRLSLLIGFLVLMGTITISLLVVANPGVGDLILKRQQKTALEAGARLAEYQNAMKEWLSSPVWGKGFGYESRFYKAGKVRSQEYVHNFILQFLMSSGIVGLMLILTMLGTAMWHMKKLFLAAQSRLQIAILVASILTVLNILIICFFHTLILKQDIYFLLAIVISFAVIIRRLQMHERAAAISSPGAASEFAGIMPGMRPSGIL